MKVVIIKYNSGNVCSLANALERLGIRPILSDEPDELISADKVIFPGVGEAGNAMKYLKEKGLHLIIPELKQDVLGICLGMQLMCAHSEEGNTDCLNIFPLYVKKFVINKEDKYKIPHVGWNNIVLNNEVNSKLYLNTENNKYVYFVHSYYVEKGIFTSSETTYIIPFSASLKKDNFYAVQYHPEKSGKTGETILRNFINL